MGFFTTRHIDQNKNTFHNTDFSDDTRNNVEVVEVGVFEVPAKQQEERVDSHFFTAKNTPEDYRYRSADNADQEDNNSLGVSGLNNVISGAKEYVSDALGNVFTGFFTSSKYLKEAQKKRKEDLDEDNPIGRLVNKYGEEDALNMILATINGMLYITEYNSPLYVGNEVIKGEKKKIVDEFFDIYSSIALYKVEQVFDYLEPFVEEMIDKKEPLPLSLYNLLNDMEHTDNPHPKMHDYELKQHKQQLITFIRDALKLTDILLKNYEADKESGFPQVNEKLYDLTYTILHEGYDEYQVKYDEMYEYFENRYKKLSGDVSQNNPNDNLENNPEDILNRNVFQDIPPRIPVEHVRDRLSVVQLDYMSAITFTGHNAEYIFTAPAILDSSVPTTGDFLDALAKAQTIIPDDDSKDHEYATELMIRAIDDLEQSWKEAVRFARSNINNPLRGAKERRARKLLETILLIDVDDPEHKNSRDALVSILDGITYDIPNYDNTTHRTVSLYTKNIFEPDTMERNRRIMYSARKAIER